MFQNKSAKYSLFAAIFACFAIVFGKSFMTEFGWGSVGGKIAWDIFGYYLYLPATFIHGDPLLTDMTWVHELYNQYNPSSTLYQIWNVKSGTHLIKYSMGMSILYLPWFLIGHFFAWITGAPMDGMSAPYQYSIAFGSYIYVFMGVYYLRKLLLKFFPDKWAALGIVLLILGTNFFQISTNATLAPHPYQFALYTWITWSVLKWYETKQRKYFITVAVLWGIAMLARPSAFVLGPIVFLWGCKSWQDIVARIKWWVTEGKMQLLKGGTIMFLIGLPQMVYWYFTTGLPIYYSYPSDGFDFATPYLAEVLFSYRKGWFIYTPLMLFSFIGLWFTWKQKPKFGLPIILFWIFNTYIISSWNTWWYGGSFGHRAFVDAYGIYIIPIVAFLYGIRKSSWLVKAPISLIIIAFCALNLFQSWQMNHWIMSDTYMTEKYYWRIFGKTSVTPEDRFYMGAERSPSSTFDRSKPYALIIDTVVTGIESHPNRWAPGTFQFTKTMRDVSTAEHTWWDIHVELTPTSTDPFWFKIQTRHDDKNVKIKEYLISDHPTPDSTYSFEVEYITPILKADRDYTRIYTVSEGSDTILIDSLSIRVYEPTWYD